MSGSNRLNPLRWKRNMQPVTPMLRLKGIDFITFLWLLLTIFEQFKGNVIQFLRPGLETFAYSVNSADARSIKVLFIEINLLLILSIQVCNEIQDDNLKTKSRSTIPTASPADFVIYFYILFLASHVFHLPFVFSTRGRTRTDTAFQTICS